MAASKKGLSDLTRERCVAGFTKAFEFKADIQVFFAPLRVNVIGEYTDIAGGLVLPCALNIGIYAAVRKRRDGRLRLASGDSPLRVVTDVRDVDGICYDEADGWANYPKGVAYEIMKTGRHFPGADIYYLAEVAQLSGAGLSSSASIEAVTAYALNDIYDLGIYQVEMAQLCQRAENNFVGVKCGIMDQFAVIAGKADHALLLDCGSLEHKHIPMDFSERGVELVVINSNKRRGLIDSKYNERRSEVEAARKIFIEEGVLKENQAICSLTEADFNRSAELIKDTLQRKRVRHLVRENQRVKFAVTFMEDGDYEDVGQLLTHSHASLRTDFEVTGEVLDALQSAAASFDGCLGARMTGAGFGGCVIAIVKSDAIERFTEYTREKYMDKTGLKADFYVCRPSDGAREV